MTLDVIHVKGIKPKKMTVASMHSGQVGYVVPWAYAIDTATLRPNHVVHSSPLGTAILQVECVISGRHYMVTWPQL